MVAQIDSHHHFWRYNPEEYSWIDDSMALLRRDFLPEDLRPEIQRAGIDGVISVQARQNLEETRWLLALAANHSFIRGVVGWVPLTDIKLPQVLQSLAGNEKLKSIRHVLQGEPDDRYMLRSDFNRGIDLLQEFNLAYDILIFERHLPYVLEFVKQHPQQVFVLDHVAKPRIRDRIVSPWRENVRELAKFPNVYCKISGMVTEAGYTTWKEEDLAPYFDTVLEAFGPSRLLFGSDWPVCLVAASYGSWLALVKRQIAMLTDSEQSAILGGTAARVYRIDTVGDKE
ncbi:MAG TPA: amidohydrolase family protein [Bryobacteraceae bacterium]|nr:amidohydrolase family protein [Bryobacteraceae bacterium]